MAEPGSFSLEALQNMLRAKIDELSIKQTEENRKQTDKLNLKFTENLNDKLDELKQRVDVYKRQINSCKASPLNEHY